MAQYLFSVIHDWDAPVTDEEMQQSYARVDAFNKKITEAGHWVFGAGLTHPSNATVVRADKGEVVTTDGPYLETKEHLGGFWVIKAADLDEALQLAQEASVACANQIEVRPMEAEPDA